jgi:hypothetical protein
VLGAMRLTAWYFSKPIHMLAKRKWARLFVWVTAVFIAASAFAIHLTEPAGAAHGYPGLCGSISRTAPDAISFVL